MPSDYPPLPHRQRPVPAPPPRRTPQPPHEIIDAEYEPATGYYPPPDAYRPPLPPSYPHPVPQPQPYPQPGYYPPPAAPAYLPRQRRRSNGTWGWLLGVLAFASAVSVGIYLVNTTQTPPPWYAGVWVAEGDGEQPQLDLWASGNQLGGRLILPHTGGKFRLDLPLLFGEAGGDNVVFAVEVGPPFHHALHYLAHYEGPNTIGLYRLAPPPRDRPYTARLLPIVAAQQRVALLMRHRTSGPVGLSHGTVGQRSAAMIFHLMHHLLRLLLDLAARVCLMAAVALFVWAALRIWQLVLVLIALCVYWQYRSGLRSSQSDAYGAAKWCDEEQAQHAGLLSGWGLFLGRFAGPSSGRLTAIWRLFTLPPTQNGRAVRQFLNAFGRR